MHKDQSEKDKLKKQNQKLFNLRKKVPLKLYIHIFFLMFFFWISFFKFPFTSLTITEPYSCSVLLADVCLSPPPEDLSFSLNIFIMFQTQSCFLSPRSKGGSDVLFSLSSDLRSSCCSFIRSSLPALALVWTFRATQLPGRDQIESQ